MALIICKECNKEISNKSNFCIHCGYKFKNENKTKNLPVESFEDIAETIYQYETRSKVIVKVLNDKYICETVTHTISSNF